MLSIIVVGKNEGWRLEKCLSAIKKATEEELHFPYEIIYVDSQSTDNSLSIARHYSDKIFLITGDCNAAIGRNIGAKEAKGNILFFIDGDMELWPGVFPSILNEDGNLVSPFISGVEYDYLYNTNWVLMDEKPRRTFIPGIIKQEETTGGLFVIEKNLWDEVGGMDHRFRLNEDKDFGIRACSKGYSLQRMGQYWVNHYTVIYTVRPNDLDSYKYKALFLRKHFCNRIAQNILFKENYSCYYLAFCFFFIICLQKFIGILIFMPYIALLCYRGYKTKQRTATKLRTINVVKNRLVQDLFFIITFFFFHPRQPQISYIRL